ncbi:hypothetical protein NXS19_006850 [Fusarium pseudograminearum]|nr:hypothetical protein NXS19_006850 [Fusarium pseudograminearum]
MTQLTKALIILAVVGASFAAPVNQPRQLGGEGAAADSIISDTDNASGYAAQWIEWQRQRRRQPPPPPPPEGRMTKMAKRQGDKLSDGAAAVLNQVGATGVADIIKTDGDAIDGQTTGDGALIGEQVGGDEEDIGERVGNLVPNKMPAAPGVPAA